MLEDKRLIWRLKRGDKEALRRLYEKYKDDLLTIAVSLLNDVNDAEDILHDVFVCFAAGVGRLQLRVSLKSYLTTAVVNRVRSKFRRKGFDVAESKCLESVSSNSESPVEKAVLGEQWQMMSEALAGIPLEQREVVVLHIKGGLKFREIARMQGIRTSTVQGRYRYGIDKLRSILGAEVTR
jgi:RNA polymerase sigma-70 factor (ECF subfamily)